MMRWLCIALCLLLSLSAAAQTYRPFTLTQGGGSNPVSPSLVTSRTTGAAPLAVHFDLSGSTATGVNKPFHELGYSCNFDDSNGAAAWTYGVRTGAGGKNIAYGPEQAHVFDNAGTNSVVCTVTDGTNSQTIGVSIVVTAADTQWAGTATLCVRQTAGGSFTGCPSGATQVTDADFDAVINTTAGNGATHKRILFECDGTYTASASGSITVSGPGYIGAYPDGCPSRAKPIVAGNPATKLGLGSSTNHTFTDWRVVGLQFSGSAGVGQAIAHAGTSTRVTILRNTINAASNGILADLNVLDIINNPTRLQEAFSELAIIENEIADSDQYGIFGAATKLMVLGNRITNSIVEHGMRTQWTQRSVVANNEFGIASKTSLTMRGVEHFVANRSGAGQYTLNDATYTELGVISENRIIGGTGALPFTLKSVNSVEDARFRNHIVENNWESLGTSALQAFQTESGLLTVRNNLFDTTNAAGAQIAISLSKSTGTPAAPDDVKVYNNSAFSNKTDAANPFIIVDYPSTSPTLLFIKNNLGVAPNNTNGTTGPTRGTAGAGSDITNNSTAAQIKGASPLSTTPPTTPTHWQPAAATYPIDAGVAVPVWRDFFQALRTGTYDYGAVNP